MQRRVITALNSHAFQRECVFQQREVEGLRSTHKCQLFRSDIGILMSHTRHQLFTPTRAERNGVELCSNMLQHRSFMFVIISEHLCMDEHWLRIIETERLLKLHPQRPRQHVSMLLNARHMLSVNVALEFCPRSATFPLREGLYLKGGVGKQVPLG